MLPMKGYYTSFRNRWQFPDGRTESIAGQNLGFLCPPKSNNKIMETELGGNKKVALIFQPVEEKTQ